MPTMSGYAAYPGRNGQRKALPDFWRLLMGHVMTKEMSIWIPKSLVVLLVWQWWYWIALRSSFIIQIKAAEILQSGTQYVLNVCHLWYVNYRSVSLGFHDAFSPCLVHTGRSFSFRLYYCLWFCIAFFCPIVLLTVTPLAILEVVRSEKKRKMENVAEFGFHGHTFDPISVDHIYQEECEEETKENGKGNAILRTNYWDFSWSPCSQPSVLPEYQGVDLKDVPTESSLFEGVTFSELLA